MFKINIFKRIEINIFDVNIFQKYFTTKFNKKTILVICD